MTLRVAIVDDEPLARDTLRMLLERDGDVTVAANCSGADAPALIAETKPDILFLDVQMPEVDGFEVLARIGPGAVPVVVFVTAYDHYALRAGEVHALEYLLKPFDDKRFTATLERAKEQVRTRRRGDTDERLLELLRARPDGAFVRRFLVRVREKVLFIRVEEIDWIEAADYYVSLHVAGKTHLLRETMNDVEKQLDPDKFVRIHRSAIVNVDRVKEMHPLFRGDAMLVLQDGTQVKVSRARREEFEQLLTRPR
jgi:two-component system LytT family response regulator